MTSTTITFRRAFARNALRIVAAMTATAAIAGQAQAAANHTDRVSCYFHVNDGCYNTEFPDCTQEEYEGFLENCDTAYPKGKARTLRGPKAFKLQ